MGLDFAFIRVAAKAGLSALPSTLLLTAAAFGIGLVLGCAVAVVRVYRVRFAARVLKILIDLIKAIPFILILYVLYFFITDAFNAVAQTLGWTMRSKDIRIEAIAVLALSVSATVTLSETVRGAFLSVEEGQYEAGYTVGLTGFQTLRRVILPQVIPVAAPVLCNNFINLLKLSSVTYIVGVMDILNASLAAATINYQYLDAYVAAALIYWAITILVERLSKLLERRLGSFRRYAYDPN